MTLVGVVVWVSLCLALGVALTALAERVHPVKVSKQTPAHDKRVHPVGSHHAK
jgi:hypothetical protein